eukprot:53470_1
MAERDSEGEGEGERPQQPPPGTGSRTTQTAPEPAGSEASSEHGSSSCTKLAFAERGDLPLDGLPPLPEPQHDVRLRESALGCCVVLGITAG